MKRLVLFVCLTVLGVGVAIGQEQEPEFSWVNPLPDSANKRLRHATFYSLSMEVDVGYNIYLPPGYDDVENQSRRYPVVYYLHGWRLGRESRSIYMAEYFDRWITSGDIPPRIYVFPHGGKYSHYDYGDSLGETAFVRELIPHIDRTYRTIAERNGRGLEGFSMGGRGTARDMFKYPELFCSAVPIGGGHQWEKSNSDVYGDGPDDISIDPTNNSWDLARDYANRDSGHDVAILVAVGTIDRNYEANLDWMAHLDSLGVSYSKVVVEGAGHEVAELYEALGSKIMRFHEHCFSKVATSQSP